MTKTIVIIDYGVGNLYSVRRAVEVCGGEDIRVSDKPQDLADADKIILPGVGAFEDGMKGMRERGLIEPIVEAAHSGKSILGICLGMQLLASSSEEFGFHEGLDLIPGEVVSIPNRTVDDRILKVPFIGWAEIEAYNTKAYEMSLLGPHEARGAVYLVHSLHVRTATPEHLLASYCLGGHRITAAIQRDNITGLQFHPEKSGQVGLAIMRNFLVSK
ncbi:MAG: imidazole glycerol phosphate synthase subunit HisH [Limnobacter sp.]|nr:imidazole glycerol phosphate synthase subunit HisH [Limnobacter sp.]